METEAPMMAQEFSRFESPTGAPISLSKVEFSPQVKANAPANLTLGITSGIHGDELNGTYICSLLVQVLKKLIDKNPKLELRAKIKILPAINPPGLNNSVRFWPFDETDINRMFPGYAQGETSQRLAAAVFQELSDVTHLLDIHSSNIFVREVPQVRLYQWDDELMRLAAAFDLPVIWLRESTTMEKVQLPQTLSENGKKSFVIQAGNALEIDAKLCKNIVFGILRWMSVLGAIDFGGGAGENDQKKNLMNKLIQETLNINGDGRRGAGQPILAKTSNILYMTAESAGIFVGGDEQEQNFPGKKILKGEWIGNILDPVTGAVREAIVSPVDGYLFTIRVHPIVYQGSLLARIVAKSDLPQSMIKPVHPQQPQ